MQESSPRSIINSIMNMIALGALSGVFFLCSISLFVGGFRIYNMECEWGAIIAWFVSAAMLSGAIVLLRLFRKAYRIEKEKEEAEDSTRRTGTLT